MPVTIRRNGRHPPHHQCGRHAEARADFDRVRLTNQEAAKRNARTHQRGGEEAALEVAPRVEHVLRTHAGAAGRGLRDSFPVASCGEMMPSPLCRMRWPTKNASSYFSRGSCDQTLVDQHGLRRLEPRTHHRARRLVVPVEPADLQAKLLADSHARRAPSTASGGRRPARPPARCRESCCDAFPATRESGVARIACPSSRFGSAVPAARSAAVHARTGMRARAASLPGRPARPAAARPRHRCSDPRTSRASLPKIPANMSSISPEGMRWPFSIMLR